MASLAELPRLKEIIIETIGLAEKLNAKYLTSSAKEGIIHETASLEKHYSNPFRIAIIDFLTSCSIEELIGIMTVMYIGRDNDSVDAKDHDELFARRYLEFKRDTKEEIIHQMIGKFTLSINLKKGIALLKL